MNPILKKSKLNNQIFKKVYKKRLYLLGVFILLGFSSSVMAFYNQELNLNFGSHKETELINQLTIEEIIERKRIEIKEKVEFDKINKTQEIELGKSTSGESIKAYYKGNPNKPFYGIFANIHGGYEYGTNKTAKYLLEELEKSGKKQWFIIPTINPDGLKFKGLVRGRSNSNNVNLDRNFCTKNYKNGINIKKGYIMKNSSTGKCESEIETKTIIKVLKEYKFNKIISLHSQGGIFFIPDGSIEDKRIVSFGNELKELLPDYDFDIKYDNQEEKDKMVFKYEIDEGGSDLYTGTMETYIYEKIGIPVILIELVNHNDIEYRLKGLIDNLED